MHNEYITVSESETFDLGKSLGRDAKTGDVFALRGDLGSGKTIMAKGIAAGLNIADDITSPTFTLMEIYDGIVPLYHFDLYRIEKDSEFNQLCFEEYWEGEGVSVIEWAEKAWGRLPEKKTIVTIVYLDSTRRRITIEDTCN
jgi:tRNA threonylcarbamoyladenosine biosynthesis protein TsaE